METSHCGPGQRRQASPPRRTMFEWQVDQISFILSCFKTVQEGGLAINSTETYVLFERSPHGGSLLKEIEGQRVVI